MKQLMTIMKQYSKHVPKCIYELEVTINDNGSVTICIVIVKLYNILNMYSVCAEKKEEEASDKRQ